MIKGETGETNCPTCLSDGRRAGPQHQMATAPACGCGIGRGSFIANCDETERDEQVAEVHASSFRGWR